jgi:hypothetical protein
VQCNINCSADPENCLSEQLIKGMADEMATGGWKEAGYEYVNIGATLHGAWPQWTLMGEDG